MQVYNHNVELIIEPSSTRARSAVPADIKKQLRNAGIEVTEVLVKAKLPPGKKRKDIFPLKKERIYVKTKIKDSDMNPWDVAHMSSKAIGAQSAFIEPDMLQEFVVDTNINAAFKRKGARAAATAIPDDNVFDPDWYPKKNIIWHLGDDYSQLKSARDAVMNIDYPITIGHIDTGYDATHKIIPDAVRKNKLQRNFVKDEDPLVAVDPHISGGLRTPGHGTGTAGILYGTKIKLETDDGGFNDYLGGAPYADVISCRISTSVILIKTSTFAEAVNYLVSLVQSGTPVHVISMSMGGAPSKAWADAVNAAYEAGITIVTASGNNFSGAPTQHVIYPARFGRVIAACGVTYEKTPYHTRKLTEMQGCYGPERHMTKALAAFTPNTPWAAGSSSAIKFSGAGTSSATPQIAAAAANYYRKYHKELDRLEPWQRVEAIRHALFTSASKDAVPIGSFKNCFGNGILKANDALKVPVKVITQMTPRDTIPWFPILTTIFKALPGEAPNNKMTMYNTELAQLVYKYPDLAMIIGNERKGFEKVSKPQWKKFRDAVIQHPAASISLKKYLMSTHT